MNIHIKHKSLSQEQFISTKKIRSIPNDLLDYNVSVLDYCADNFESISHITSIQEREIKSQYFFTINKDSVANETSFKGLQLMSKIQFESIDDSVIEEKAENEYEGLAVFRDVPPKNKSVEKSEGFALKSPYDSCIDACIDAQKDTKAWIISTIEKRGSFSLPSFPSSIKWIWVIHLLNTILWVGEILGLFYVLKNEWNIIAERFYRDSEYFGTAQTLTEFIQNNNVRLGFFLLAFLIVGGILVLAMMWRANRKIRSDFNLKNQATQIAEAKEETAKQNHSEEEIQWGSVYQSFVVLIRGSDIENVCFVLESLKKSIEGIYKGCIFEIKGNLIIQGKTGFSEKLKMILGWSLRSFWSSFHKVKPFKPTLMSIPRSGNNYFRLVKEKYIPGAEIIESLSYKINTNRTKHGLYLGHQHRNITGESYPYHIKPQDLVRHGFVFGQTGRGKSFFVFNLLIQLMKYYSDIKFMILDPKGEYARLFADREDVTVFIIDSEVAPLGINIFKILENVEENKLLVSKLLREYIITVKGYQAELSAFMEYVINQAIDLVYHEEPDNWHMKTFILKINQFLDEKAEEKIGWAEKTRLALNARFRELFTGRFKSIFCVKESNLTRELLLSNNIIIQMHKLLLKQEEETLQFLASVITALIANYLEGLFDLELDVPRYIYVLDELQKLVPLRNFDIKRFIVSYLEIARAHRVTIKGTGQDPDEIAKVFRQAGFTVDFGTHSTSMDKIIFEKDHLRAPEEKEQLAPEQMCFIKLHGERRVLLRVADFDTTKAINESRLMSVLKDKVSSQIIRANHQLIPISVEDLEGKIGKQRIRKKDLLAICQQNCDNGHCNGFAFTKYRLPKKSIADLKELVEKEEFLEFCYREANNKQDFPCVLIYYLGHLLDNNAFNVSDAEQMLQDGLIFTESQKTLRKRRDEVQTWLTEDEPESPYGFENEVGSSCYNFDFEENDDFDID